MRGSVLGVAVIVGWSMGGCSSSSSKASTTEPDPATPKSTDAGAGTKTDAGRAIGEACLPGEESDTTFQGFSVDDVSIEAKTGGCGSNVCMLNHFQGRTTCPYGQTAPGVGPVGPAGSPAAIVDSEDGCALPGTTPKATSTAWQVKATNVSVAGFAAGAVPAQIVGVGAGDRTANKTVYCSCRCANLEGKTDDGASYCTCPTGLACTPLVSPIVPGDPTAGSYCALEGTTYSAATTDTASICDAMVTDTLQPGYCPVQSLTAP
jgi:hypothetical protein